MSQHTIVGNVKIGLNPTTASIQGLYTYRIASRAASQVWLGIGGQRIGVRGVPGSIPGGTIPFDGVKFQMR